MCCSGLTLIPPTQGGQPQLLQLTEPIVPSLSYPALSLQPYTPAGRAGKRLPRESFIKVINALGFTKFHQSSPPRSSQTIVLYAFFLLYQHISCHKSALTICVCVIGNLEAVCTSVHKLCVGVFVCFSVYVSLWPLFSDLKDTWMPG